MDNILDALQAHGLRRQQQIVGNFQSKNISGKILKKAEESESKESEGGEHWITVSGRHILIGEGGEVKQGGKGMADGKDIKKVGGKGPRHYVGSKDEKTGKFKKQEPRKRHFSDEDRVNLDTAIANEKPHSKEKLEQMGKEFSGESYKEREFKKPSNKELRATEFEETYSKKEAKKYAEGGIPTPKSKSKKEIKEKYLKNVDKIDDLLEEDSNSSGTYLERTTKTSKKLAQLLGVEESEAFRILIHLNDLAENNNSDATAADFADKLFARLPNQGERGKNINAHHKEVARQIKKNGVYAPKIKK